MFSSSAFTWKMISDPLYGYVYFNSQIEEPIINNVLVQRLRYIMQLQTAHFVYPGAVHTRFQHSTGVLHLAGLMAEDMVNKLVSIYGKDVLEGFDPATIIEAVRLAGLLHDVGHAAFSHAFEHGILWRRDLPLEISNHERIGVKLIEYHVMDVIEKASEKLLPGLEDLLMELIGFDNPTGFTKIFRWIVKEGYYPADVIDFLRRDSYYSGTVEYGSILYERLYKNTYPVIEGGKVYMVLDRIAIGEFKQYMYARSSMYEHVYYHSVCRAFDRILFDILDSLDEELGLTKRVLSILHGDTRGYLELTDAYLYAVMMNKALHSDTRLGKMCKRMLIDRKPEWKRVGRELSLTATRGVRELETVLKLLFDKNYRVRVISDLTGYLVDSLRAKGIDESELWVDMLDITPLPKSTIYPGEDEEIQTPIMYIGKKTSRGVIISEEFNPFMEEFPLKVIFRTYVKREKYDSSLEPVVSSIISESIRDILGVDLSEFKRVVHDIYSKYISDEFSRYKLTA